MNDFRFSIKRSSNQFFGYWSKSNFYYINPVYNKMGNYIGDWFLMI